MKKILAIMSMFPVLSAYPLTCFSGSISNPLQSFFKTKPVLPNCSLKSEPNNNDLNLKFFLTQLINCEKTSQSIELKLNYLALKDDKNPDSLFLEELLKFIQTHPAVAKRIAHLEVSAADNQEFNPKLTEIIKSFIIQTALPNLHTLAFRGAFVLREPKKYVELGFQNNNIFHSSLDAKNLLPELSVAFQKNHLPNLKNLSLEYGLLYSNAVMDFMNNPNNFKSLKNLKWLSFHGNAKRLKTQHSDNTAFEKHSQFRAQQLGVPHSSYVNTHPVALGNTTNENTNAFYKIFQSLAKNNCLENLEVLRLGKANASIEIFKKAMEKLPLANRLKVLDLEDFVGNQGLNPAYQEALTQAVKKYNRNQKTLELVLVNNQMEYTPQSLNPSLLELRNHNHLQIANNGLIHQTSPNISATSSRVLTIPFPHSNLADSIHYLAKEKPLIDSHFLEISEKSNDRFSAKVKISDLFQSLQGNEHIKKIAIYTQTPQKENAVISELSQINIKKFFPALESINIICPQTSQKAIRQLSYHLKKYNIQLGELPIGDRPETIMRPLISMHSVQTP